MLVASAAWHVFEHMDRRSAISPKRGELLGDGRILPLVASEDALQAEEPPTSEASEDILHLGNLRAISCGGPCKKTNIDDSSRHAKCVQGLTLAEVHKQRKE